MVVGTGMSVALHQLPQTSSEVTVPRALDGFRDAYPPFPDHPGRKPHVIPHRLGGRIVDVVGMPT
jgi:hypothetical protein